MKVDEPLDFPTLVLRLIAAGETVAAYPTDEFWLDIGNKDDFERAGEEFEKTPGGSACRCGFVVGKTGEDHRRPASL